VAGQSNKFTPKQLRVVRASLMVLLDHAKAFEGSARPKDLGLDIIARLVRAPAGGSFLLSDAGIAALGRIASTIDEVGVFNDSATFRDIEQCSRRIFEELLAEPQTDIDSSTFVERVCEKVRAGIATYSFLVPVAGVQLVGIEVLPLGVMSLAASPNTVVESAGVRDEKDTLPLTRKAVGQCSWLHGRARGTRNYTERKFREQAELSVGVLAVLAASNYSRGAGAFRIGLVMSRAAASGSAVWLSWNDVDLSLVSHHQFADSEELEVSQEFIERFPSPDVVEHMFAILHGSDRTEVGEAIARGFYWFSDAQRDPVPVMRLVKYWSCVETFFSFSASPTASHLKGGEVPEQSDRITQSVSAGLAVALVFGGYGFFPPEEYRATRRRVTQLYRLRSTAVHSAKHSHVRISDVDLLSKWAAWLLVSMVALASRGYETLAQVKTQTDRLDRQMMAEPAQHERK
jgi:hypothetical protein